jgi:2-polyprenyl-6-methoxyphenol hydroxylase-like FAD-dependent oxidoreductase
MRYDVIVVGARVAGAATAMLLARAGLRVLAVDRVSFPSDTISSHQVQLPGVALLHRWGLLDRLVAAGTPPTRRVRFDPGPVVLEGAFPGYCGVDALYSPRRTLLDAMLVTTARDAGAEVVEGVRVEELTRDADGRVNGIRGTRPGGVDLRATAALVVGADGKHSFVARQVGARPYRTRPVRAFACYGYHEGVPLVSGELYQRPGRTVAAFPTNEGLTMVYVAGPLAEFDRFRRDIEESYLDSLDICADLGERVRGGHRVERLRTTPDQPNTFRAASGPGWALVGDAGVVMDSITAQGISNALRDADRLAAAIATAFGGAVALATALAAHGRRRDREISASYDFTTGLAEFRTPTAIQRRFFGALRGRPDEITRLLAAFAGITPIDDFLSVRNATRLIATSWFGPSGRDRVVVDPSSPTTVHKGQ